ncbi:MAG: efflux RND transporter periplasmic adaptor subunit, partial [Bdellovibrionales bacterium]|nr:efflux RND transporter periplasmic adaptor subunit [Bdellovibrionales bacterium]
CLSEDQISSLTKKGFQSEGLLVSGQDNIVYADVFEIDLPYIKEGQSAQISANFLQGKILPGKVISVDQVINPETRTAKVRIKLLKSDSSIRPESYVNATVFAPLGKHTTIPLEAIMDTGVDTYIFLKKDEGIFEPKKIRVILETESEAAIAGEVSPGNIVVVGANFLIDSESRLKAMIQTTDGRAE